MRSPWHAPIFLIHGMDDTFLDPDYAMELYEAAPDPKELWRPEGVAHAGLEETLSEEYAARLGEWLGRWE